MRSTILAALMASAATFALAQEATIAAPDPGIANYDPTMSAKEAVLANWELAAAGIRAGRIMGQQVVEMAESDASYTALARQAQFAQKTMVQRYNAALWIYTEGSGVQASKDSTALTAAVSAAFTPCVSEPCASERDALATSFAEATTALDAAANSARSALSAREGEADRALMTEQLSLIAAYLEGGAWAEGFALTDFDRDADEVAARIVGVMSLWRNIEPYVGLANPEIDHAINSAGTDLLRTLRKVTRGAGVLAPDGPELTQLREKAAVLAVEFQRASALFSV